MGKFCKTHAKERTTEELKARMEEIRLRSQRQILGPKLLDELTRINSILTRRAGMHTKGAGENKEEG